MKLSPFLKEHKKNLRKLTKKQLIQQVINHIELHAQVENEFDMGYEKLDNEKQICESELIRTEKELEETQEALRRSRNQLEAYKNYEKSCYNYREILSYSDQEIAKYENFSIFQFIKHKYSK